MSRNKREGRFYGKYNRRFCRKGDAAARQRWVDDFIAFLDKMNMTASDMGKP